MGGRSGVRERERERERRKGCKKVKRGALVVGPEVGLRFSFVSFYYYNE